MALAMIGLGILIIWLVVTGKWNDFIGAIFNPLSTPQGKPTSTTTTTTTPAKSA